jgi:hypothetical protein
LGAKKTVGVDNRKLKLKILEPCHFKAGENIEKFPQNVERIENHFDFKQINKGTPIVNHLNIFEIEKTETSNFNKELEKDDLKEKNIKNIPENSEKIEIFPDIDQNSINSNKNSINFIVDTEHALNVKIVQRKPVILENYSAIETKIDKLPGTIEKNKDDHIFIDSLTGIPIQHKNYEFEIENEKPKEQAEKNPNFKEPEKVEKRSNNDNISINSLTGNPIQNKNYEFENENEKPKEQTEKNPNFKEPEKVEKRLNNDQKSFKLYIIFGILILLIALLLKGFLG